MRLFLGIELPESLKNEIATILSPLKKTERGWEHSHDYHLTLLFIGEVASSSVMDISARMMEIRMRPFTLTTCGFHFFSHRIMYLGFEPSPETLALRKEVLRVYPEFYRKEEREFIPHVTVKRGRGREVSMEPATISVSGLSLFKSEKDPENRKYHVIQRVDF